MQMKRLREFIFDDSSSEEEGEENDDSKIAMTVILNDEIQQPRLGSLFVRL
jgi:hypothetical protein